MRRRGISVISLLIVFAIVIPAGVLVGGALVDAPWEYFSDFISGLTLESEPSTGEFSWDRMAVYSSGDTSFGSGTQYVVLLEFTRQLNDSLPEAQQRALENGETPYFNITSPADIRLDYAAPPGEFDLTRSQISFNLSGATGALSHEESRLTMEITNVTSGDGKLIKADRCTAVYEDLSRPNGNMNWSNCTGALGTVP